ncbi:MAG: hypothetical protein EPN79_02250 [Burkholderiaceae bacterium]|nr:MAG: hypothetical protein EPN79_02250 [Burkholderiaceae bacterium]TBR76143.1 MAG: hypothetical protein EPN64_09025 [Burkholderiaceae bacterium]
MGSKPNAKSVSKSPAALDPRRTAAALGKAMTLLTKYADEIKASSCSLTGDNVPRWDSGEDERLFRRCQASVRALGKLREQGLIAQAGQLRTATIDGVSYTPAQRPS